MDESVSGSKTIVERVREIAERVAASHNIELVHVETAREGRNPALRIFIDKPEGVTHQDCSTISEHLGAILDVEDFISNEYTLEVSSPGLERGLYSRADYERFKGQAARIRTRRGLNGQRNFHGHVVGVEGGDVMFEDRTRGLVSIPLEAIAKANLEIDTEAEFRRAKELEKQRSISEKDEELSANN